MPSPNPTTRIKDNKSIQTQRADLIHPAVLNICCNLIAIGRVLDGYNAQQNSLLEKESAILVVEALNYLTQKALSFVTRHEPLYAVQTDENNGR